MLRYADIELTMTPGTDITPGIDRVYAYLAKRGICRDDIDALNLWIVPAGALITQARGAGNSMDTRLAVVFPHYGVGGVPIDWWSARLIDAGMPMGAKGFGALVERKMGKMFCPPNEPPHAYLVPTLDWTQLKRGDYVYIHESCIKAVAGAKLGFWSVGLNGVRGWSSRKHELALVDELRGLPWKALQLQPVIVFDSNAADNWDVQHAISGLAAKLEEVTGQCARHILLPPGPAGHWGFDDFCVARGAEESRLYLESAHRAEPVEVSSFERLRLELQRKVCVVRSLGRIAEQDTGTLMTRGTFTDVNYAHYVCEGDEGKQVSVPRVWMTDERRVEVEGLRYVPGGEPIVPLVPGKERESYLNLWRGMGVEPEPGDVGPWLELLEAQIPDAELRKWVIQWFAYPLQVLGGKLNTYVHMFGPPGTGKNAIIKPILRIYGGNGVVISKDQIESSFNSIYAGRQFVNLDELTRGSDSAVRAVTQRIKMLTTTPTLVVNKKGEPEYEVDNVANLVTLSNYLDSVRLDDGERRALVLRIGVQMGDVFWRRFWEWSPPRKVADDWESAAAVYAHLLGVDLSDFNPAAWAPHTEWREDVLDAGRDPMEKWVRDLWDDPESALPPILRGAKVLTPEQVGAAYLPDDPHKNTPGLRNQLGQRMQERGFKRTGQIKVDGAPKRFWIIEDKDGEWGNERVREEAGRRRGKY